MNRVQILLKPETLQKVKMVAKRKKVSASKLVREAVEKELDLLYPKVKQDTVEVLRNAAKHAFKGGPRDLSSNDDYLYKI